MKNKGIGKIISVIAIAILTTGLIAGCGNSGSTGSSATETETVTEPETEETKAAAEPETKESELEAEDTENDTDASEEQISLKDADPADRWDSFTVQIEDLSLTLPSTIEEMSGLGLTLDDYEVSADTKIEAGDYQSAVFTDGTHRILFHISNTDSAAKAAAECLVDTIVVSSAEVADGMKIVLPGGIQIGSTLDEAIEKWGETESIYEGDSNSYYTWSTEDYKGSCTLVVNNETKEITDIEYGTKESEVEAEDTENDADASEEQISLKDADPNARWDSFTVQIEDQSLTLPSTIEEMSGLGWTLDDYEVSEDTKIEAGDYQPAMFTDGTHRILFKISNTDSATKAAAECLVDTIVVSSADGADRAKIVLPGGIQIGSTLDEVNEKWGETESVYEEDSASYYFWNTEDYKGSCTLVVNNETKKITGILYGTK